MNSSGNDQNIHTHIQTLRNTKKKLIRDNSPNQMNKEWEKD